MVLLSAFWPGLGKHFPGSLVKNTVNYNTRPSLGIDSELGQWISNDRGREVEVIMARLAAAKGWFLSSGGSKGSLSSGHTCVEQSNNYKDRVF